MIKAYLSLGSNLNYPERQIRLALQSLRNTPRIHLLKTASLYFNKAWGRKAQPDFCNTVVEITTTLSPMNLLKTCQMLEHKHGRVRKIRWGARTLDIDILLYGLHDFINPDLTIPHPRMLERDFVLIPLMEIHPIIY
jgi:2-amino-4-hydroxy-6-hydroxymethyldihydropteridine diphosphokinase